MARPVSIQPTKRELEILQVLWDKGPCTSHEITAVLNRKRKVAHTTVFTILQIMVEKRFVDKDETRRSHVYTALESKEEVQEQIIDDVLQRVFQGSAADFFLRALSRRPTSAEELAQIRELLDELAQQS